MWHKSNNFIYIITIFLYLKMSHFLSDKIVAIFGIGLNYIIKGVILSISYKTLLNHCN